jgi:hypothetical protein
MRTRLVKPALFRNEVLAECHPLGRLLFIGLWCAADASGRLEDRPVRLKADILPYDNVDVNELLDQLAARGFIIRYTAEGRRLIQVVTFLKHQRPHHREASEGFPPPPGEHGPEKVGPSLEKVGHSPDKVVPSRGEMSFNPLPLTLNPSSEVGGGRATADKLPVSRNSSGPHPPDKVDVGLNTNRDCPVFQALVEVTGMDAAVNGEDIARVATKLRNAGRTAEDVRKTASDLAGAEYWSGDPPTLKQIQQNIGRTRNPAATKRRGTNGRPQRRGLRHADDPLSQE